MVAHNSINSMACVTICAGVLENEGLSKLVMDGNPIGVEGAKALMVMQYYSFITTTILILCIWFLCTY